MATAWTCSHQLKDECILLKKPCLPGMKGCTLYGKATFCENDLDVDYEKVESKNRYSQEKKSRTRG